MYNIAICIPTYKRPLMLKNLVLSINRCDLNKSLIANINIIIVDNDIDKTAEKTVFELKERFYGFLKINYHNYPVKGLSNVRNELLKKALELNPDFIVFIDDDEYASVEWLNELVEAIIINNGDMAMGPVISVFDSSVSKYISCWFERPIYQNNTKIESIATNNLIIKTDSLLKNKIWFDSRFNKTGSEDSYFGVQMIKKGAVIYWAANAIVYETIPKDRTNIIWVMKRRYRSAANFVYILKLEKQYSKLFKKFMVSLIYVISGTIALIILILPVKRRLWGILKIAEGIGGLLGLINIRYDAY